MFCRMFLNDNAHRAANSSYDKESYSFFALWSIDFLVPVNYCEWLLYGVYIGEEAIPSFSYVSTRSLQPYLHDNVCDYVSISGNQALLKGSFVEVTLDLSWIRKIGGSLHENPSIFPALGTIFNSQRLLRTKSSFLSLAANFLLNSGA